MYTHVLKLNYKIQVIYNKNNNVYNIYIIFEDDRRHPIASLYPSFIKEEY